MAHFHWPGMETLGNLAGLQQPDRKNFLTRSCWRQQILATSLYRSHHLRHKASWTSLSKGEPSGPAGLLGDYLQMQTLFTESENM